MGHVPTSPVGTGGIQKWCHVENIDKVTPKEIRWNLGVCTHWGGAGGVNSVAYQGVYIPITERNTLKHIKKGGDGENTVIISNHDLIVTGDG